jgi:gluconate 2-dehydrogenase gamma chain
MDSSREEASPRSISRKGLLKRAGVLGVAAALPATVASESALAERDEVQLAQLAAVSPSEARTLEAFLERLIPSDGTGPGAKEANVLRYMDRALAGQLFAFRAPYVAALASLDAYSQTKFGTDFADLTTAQQDAVLTDMDKNVATGFTPSAKAVFEMIRTHAVQGMFGDPAHGGNTNFVGWKLVRFPGPRLVISAADQRLDVVPKQSLKSAYSIPLFKNTRSG